MKYTNAVVVALIGMTQSLLLTPATLASETPPVSQEVILNTVSDDEAITSLDEPAPAASDTIQAAQDTKSDTHADLSFPAFSQAP